MATWHWRGHTNKFSFEVFFFVFFFNPSFKTGIFYRFFIYIVFCPSCKGFSFSCLEFPAWISLLWGCSHAEVAWLLFLFLFFWYHSLCLWRDCTTLPGSEQSHTSPPYLWSEPTHCTLGCFSSQFHLAEGKNPFKIFHFEKKTFVLFFFIVSLHYFNLLFLNFFFSVNLSAMTHYQSHWTILWHATL